MSEKLIGKTLDGRFVLEEELGTGASGAVYRATQTAVDRVVAVKTLHAFLQEREDFKARFEIEAKAIARLNHPNCITLYDFGYDSEFDVFYMAVEYIEGESLGEMMGREHLDYEEAMSISYQIAEALDHAHQEGILHRDLKPENIMIQRSRNSGRPIVKVLDFGLARLYETKMEGGEESPTGRYKQITKAGQVYGTPAYMSPEQCRSTDELTAATDLYSLGTMMYEMFEGKLPFFSQSTAELIMMQMTEDPPRMERIDVPKAVRDIVFQMMQKDPEARPASANEVLLSLMSHTRLDASQEFRIVPSDSGSYRITEDDLDKVAFSTMEEATDAAFVPFDLSNDEIRAAVPSKRVPIAVAILAIFSLFVVGTLALSGGDDDVDTAEPLETATVVDEPADSIASSESDETDGAEEAAGETDEVEVAKTSAKKKRKSKSTKKPKADAPDSDPNRPKTLKLTY